MTRRSSISKLSTDSTLSTTSDDTANPFGSSRAYSTNDSTTSLPRPIIAVLPDSRQQRMAVSGHYTSNSIGQDEILTVGQEDEQSWTHRHQSSNDRISYDPEKAAYIGQKIPRSRDPEKNVYASPRTSQPCFLSNDVLSAVHSEHSSSLEGLQARKALSILLYLAGPCVLLSFVTMIWAFLSLLVTILYQPLRLCTSRLSFGQQLCHLLAPTLTLHLRCIYAPVYPRPVDSEETYRAFWLLAVHMMAPAISLGDAIAAWVVAVYWGLARIVGDPSGVDKKDDGVEAVLGLTRWWESCLMKGVKLQ